MKRIVVLLLVACAAWVGAQRADAQVTVTVDPGASWNGFMNVFELPANGGGYVFGSPWGTGDLRANFAGPVLTLEAAPIGTSDSFWYQGGTGGPGIPGNKRMEANFYQEVTGPYSGINLTFTGNVLSNTLAPGYTVIAFIKDFAADYSSSVTSTAPLIGGVFSVSTNTIPLPGRHVQWGFQVVGANVWPTDVSLAGSVQVTAVPEPASLAMGGLALMGLLVVRRHR